MHVHFLDWILPSAEARWRSNILSSSYQPPLLELVLVPHWLGLSFCLHLGAAEGSLTRVWGPPLIYWLLHLEGSIYTLLFDQFLPLHGSWVLTFPFKALPQATHFPLNKRRFIIFNQKIRCFYGIPYISRSAVPTISTSLDISSSTITVQ